MALACLEGRPYEKGTVLSFGKERQQVKLQCGATDRGISEVRGVIFSRRGGRRSCVRGLGAR